MAQATRQRDRASSETTKENAVKLNAAAPEFIPRHHIQLKEYFYPYFQYPDDYIRNSFYDQEQIFPPITPAHIPHQNFHLNENDELKSKIIEQAEYLFSDLSLLANDSFAKHVAKDPEGFVPINFVTTTKKLKSLNVSNQMVVRALMSSPKLLVSNDGKRVRRRQPFTDKDKEELQMRTVIAENLPDDHSHANIEKLFSVVGKVKSIYICQPQEPNSSRSCRSDIVISNKLHALVEYEKAETAEKAAEQLSDEQNWRKGMRVRVVLKRSSKNLMKNRKTVDGYVNEDESVEHQQPHEYLLLRSSTDPTEKGGWLPTRKLMRTNSLPIGSSSTPNGEMSTSKQMVKGPRMPDGTRGFNMGRGKSLFLQMQSS